MPGESVSAGGNDYVGAMGSILLVEDEALVREGLARLLKRLGHEVEVADDGASALPNIGVSANLSLLVTDVVLPGDLNGYDLAQRARETDPHLPVLFMSGYARDRVKAVSSALDDRTRFLGKPFEIDAFTTEVRILLDLSTREPTDK